MKAVLGAGARAHRAAAVALLLLPLAVFAPAVFGGRVFFERDILFYWHPHIETAVRAIAGGAWPTWAPEVVFGRPLLADPNLQLLYPPTWLNLLMSPAAYYTLYAVAHCWLAGAGLLLLARACGTSTVAAALGGALFAASGPLLSSVNLFHHFAGAAWMPWVLLAVSRALAVPTTGSAALLGLAGAGQALAGSADMALLTVVAALLQGAVHVFDGGPAWRTRLLAATRVGLPAVAFAASLAAVQWLPALFLLSGAARGGQDLAVSTTWSVHPASLADVWFPRLVAGLPLHAAGRAALFDGRAPLLASVYLGIASAPLVGLALAGPAHALKRWALPAFACFVVGALGRHTVLYGLVASVPPFSLLRYPAKLMLAAALFWSLLAARGLDVWCAEWTAATRRGARITLAVGAAVVFACGVGALHLWRSPAALSAWAAGAAPRAAAVLALGGATLALALFLLALRAARAAAPAWLTASVCALAVLDVALAGRTVNRLGPPEIWRYQPPAAAYVRAAAPEGRLYVRQETRDRLDAALLRGPGGWDSPEGWAIGSYDLVVPPTGARWRIAGSYDGDFTGLATQALTVFTLVVPKLADHPLSLKLLRAAGVTHVTSLGEQPMFGLRESAAFPSVFSRPVRVYEVPDPLPRAYTVGGARTAATYNEAMAALAEDTLDPRREVILPAGTAVHPPAPGFAGTAVVTSRRADRLDVDVELSAPGWLVLLEASDPGWRARVDGTSTPVLTANALFRAVPVPAGRHRVELEYHPPGLRAGLALSAGGLAAMLATAAARRDRVPAAWSWWAGLTRSGGAAR